jgi:hypothetical protein
MAQPGSTTAQKKKTSIHPRQCEASTRGSTGSPRPVSQDERVARVLETETFTPFPLIPPGSESREANVDATRGGQLVPRNPGGTAKLCRSILRTGIPVRSNVSTTTSSPSVGRKCYVVGNTRPLWTRTVQQIRLCPSSPVSS